MVLFILLTGCSNNLPAISPALMQQDMASGISASAVKEVDYFGQTDLNNDIFIDYKELVTEMLKSQPYFYGDVRETAKQLFVKVDTNNDKKITRKEYYSFTDPGAKSKNSLDNTLTKQSNIINSVKNTDQDQAAKYFSDSDLNKDGSISFKELLTVMMENQPYFYGDINIVAKQLMTKIDKNQNGKITKTEYIKGMQN